MTSVQSGDLAAGFIPGSAWGLGWSIVREPQGVTAALSPGWLRSLLVDGVIAETPRNVIAMADPLNELGMNFTA